MLDRQALRITLAAALLAGLAVLGFWPHYLGPLLREGKALPLPVLHLHAALVSTWLLMLVLQPLLIARRQLRAHRALGRLAWALAPAIVVSSLLLAVQMTRPAAGAGVEPFRYGLFFVQIGTSLLFGACAAVALARRHDRALHQRAMLASGLSFVDPVLARVCMALAPAGSWWANYGSIAIAAACMLLAIAIDRQSPRGRWIFIATLIAFAVISAGGLTVNALAPWRAFVDRL